MPVKQDYLRLNSCSRITHLRGAEGTKGSEDGLLRAREAAGGGGVGGPSEGGLCFLQLGGILSVFRKATWWSSPRATDRSFGAKIRHELSPFQVLTHHDCG